MALVSARAIQAAYQVKEGGGMKNLALGIKCFARDERGASAVEYGILVALIAVAILITVYLVGQKLEEVFNRIYRCLNNSSDCGA